MRHLKSGSKLGRNPWHRRATLRNLVTNLFEHGRITTTLTRAKAARPVAEKIITLGKRDTLPVSYTHLDVYKRQGDTPHHRTALVQGWRRDLQRL